MNDPNPIMLWMAYQEGFNKLASSSTPCSICRTKCFEHGELRTHFHGSEVGACARQVYYNLISLEKRPPVTNGAFLMDGHNHEAEIIQGINTGLTDGLRIVPSVNLDELVFERRMNGTVNDDQTGLLFTIIGHTDGYLLKDNKPIAVIECKSVKDYTWKKVKDGIISDVWYGQMQAYMMMSNLNVCYLLVRNRGTCELLQPILIPLDKEYLKTRMSKLKEILIAVYNGGDIEKEAEKKTDNICKFCDYKYNCWGE